MSIIEFLQEICIKNPMNTQSIERKEAEKKKEEKMWNFNKYGISRTIIYRFLCGIDFHSSSSIFA